MLPIIISFAEFVVLLLAVFAIREMFVLAPISVLTDRMLEHLVFGLKGALSGVMGQLSTRIDILMLGIFMNDKIVGIYSFAAILIEGISQLFMVVRVNIAPSCTRLLSTRRLVDAEEFIKSVIKRVYKVAIPFGLLVALGYFFVLPQVHLSEI